MTEAGDPGAQSAAGTFAAVDDQERVLGRENDGRMITGVCAGLGKYMGMDPVIFRVGFAALVIGSGIGIMLYVAAFLLMRTPDGGPGYAEQWSRRVFDPETVMGLLGAIFTLGLVINLASDGIGTATVVVGTLLAITLLTAHARGVDLLALARSLPERLRTAARRPAPQPHPYGPPAFAPPMGPAGAGPAATGMPGTGTPGMPGMHATAAYPQDAPPAPPAAGHEQAPPAPGAPRAPEAPRAPGTPPPYRSLAELAREAAMEARQATEAARAAQATGGPAQPAWQGRRSAYDSSGEPFAPHGPYARRPYDPYEQWTRTGTVHPPRKRERRPRAYVGVLTFFIAFLVGGIMVATQAPPSSSQIPLIGGVTLIIVGAGLLITTWFDRGAGLVAVGAVLSVVLIAGAGLGDIPRNIGSYTWSPVDTAQPVRVYSVGIGDGTLDLSDTRLTPGSRSRFDASVSVGEIKVIVPRGARVEVSGHTRLGDVKIEHRVKGGADVTFNRVLEPDVPVSGPVPVIELHVKAGIGDVEVSRAA
ncbi:PspC domain-containing protein [Sphaerisporangium rubeum]|uniref:Phage shock protein PspC (Stress-responsive transcriptional regulator) n=1 Tax=Sphaerisporangium rubeum TaxID=321317 RepID=A0A7X0IB99_9ACTN|nr:PspC domain-containing protein [Sphaerisporangium rubeum]MBB6471893.1 phage shock protein PspC (stress-responsive transcriptional regulator) [Sphaerisporangium rubeum]